MAGQSRSAVNHENFDRQCLEIVGRIAFQVQTRKVPDPSDRQAFDAWVDEALQSLGPPRNPERLGAWYDPIVAAMESAFGTLLNPISKEIQTLTDSVGTVTTNVENVLEDTGSLVGKLVNGLETWVEDVGNAAANTAKRLAQEGAITVSNGAQEITAAIKTELLQEGGQFTHLLNHLTLVRSMENAGLEYADRFKISANSILTLVEAAAPQAKLIGDLLGKIEKVLFGTRANGNCTEDVESVAEDLAELSFYLFEQSAGALVPLLMLMPAPERPGVLKKLFPTWVPPGTLSRWLNGTGDFSCAFDKDPQKRAEELAFRRRLVAALDQYFRTGSSTFGTLLRGGDQRSGVDALLDLVSVLSSTVFGFVLRSPLVPSSGPQKAPFASYSPVVVRPDDVAGEMAATLSRHIVQPVRSMLSVVLNGLWAFSPNNQALVDAASGSVSHMLQSILEGVIGGVLWSFELHETYVDGSLADKDDLLSSWRSGETYGTGLRLQYCLYRRPGFFANVTSDALKALLEIDTVQQLLQDYAAYREALVEYRGVGFTWNPDKITFDATFDATGVAITATSSWGNMRIPSVPVLRAYCNGIPAVLTPAQGPSTAGKRAYGGRIDNVTIGPVWVRSNYGGIGLKPNDSTTSH